MSKTHNATAHHHHHHESSKKKQKETPHKLLDTPPYSNFYFMGDGFERLSPQPQANVRVTNYYDRKKKYGFIQNEDDVDTNVDAEAANFIESTHRKFELRKSITITRG
ncbi:unnamed protein product [Lactuca saligna]|uniref:Uncharacterized protein n=1 Tax=Lactuca saligna TaxID=75948 RepID=A0AA35Y6U4_LACSI|nr:unnamed protein product [Lactuca saligna]